MSTPVTSCVVGSAQVTGFLAGTYGWSRSRAAKVASIATSYESKAEPTAGGFVQVTWQPGTATYLVEDHTGKDISL